MPEQTWPFGYRDIDGDVLRIDHGTANHALVYVNDTRGEAASVPAAVLPSVIAALYEGAGLSAPVILDRPDHPRASLVHEGVTYTIRAGRGIDATRVHRGCQTGTLYDTPVLRGIAAALAALCDEADAGPDPAAVEELTAVIRQVPNGTQIDDLARAIVRAGWKREAAK